MVHLISYNIFYKIKRPLETKNVYLQRHLSRTNVTPLLNDQKDANCLKANVIPFNSEILWIMQGTSA